MVSSTKAGDLRSCSCQSSFADNPLTTKFLSQCEIRRKRPPPLSSANVLTCFRNSVCSKVLMRSALNVISWHSLNFMMRFSRYAEDMTSPDVNDCLSCRSFVWCVEIVWLQVPVLNISFLVDFDTKGPTHVNRRMQSKKLSVTNTWCHPQEHHTGRMMVMWLFNRMTKRDLL